MRPVPRGLSSCNYTKIQLGPNPCSGCQPGLAAGLLPPQCPSSFGHSREPSRCLGGHGCPQPCCLPALPRSLPPAREGIGAGLAQPLPPGVTPQANGPSTSSLSPLVWGFFFSLWKEAKPPTGEYGMRWVGECPAGRAAAAEPSSLLSEHQDGAAPAPLHRGCKAEEACGACDLCHDGFVKPPGPPCCWWSLPHHLRIVFPLMGNLVTVDNKYKQ